MTQAELEAVEIELVLEALCRRSGYDFRSYARASVTRRLRQLMEQKGIDHASALIPKLLHEPAFLHELLAAFSVTVSAMFRDPDFWCSLRENVIPLLQTYPHVRAWVAGCACGEEAYSLAILFKEEGLLAKSTIYATDISDRNLAAAKAGIYPLRHVREYSQNYQKSGPQDTFSSYSHASHDHIIMNRDLKKRITFANHNLAADQVFAEMHLILCRNVMIYFNQDLKNQVLGLLNSSLIRGGFLCLGTKESLLFSILGPSGWNEIDSRNKIYRKRIRDNEDDAGAL